LIEKYLWRDMVKGHASAILRSTDPRDAEYKARLKRELLSMLAFGTKMGYSIDELPENIQSVCNLLEQD
jgi:hypothetical protein